MVWCRMVSNGVEWCGVKWCQVSFMTLESLLARHLPAKLAHDIRLMEIKYFISIFTYT